MAAPLEVRIARREEEALDILFLANGEALRDEIHPETGVLRALDSFLDQAGSVGQVVLLADEGVQFFFKHNSGKQESRELRRLLGQIGGIAHFGSRVYTPEEIIPLTKWESKEVLGNGELAFRLCASITKGDMAAGTYFVSALGLTYTLKPSTGIEIYINDTQQGVRHSSAVNDTGWLETSAEAIVRLDYNNHRHHLLKIKRR